MQNGNNKIFEAIKYQQYIFTDIDNNQYITLGSNSEYLATWIFKNCWLPRKCLCYSWICFIVTQCCHTSWRFFFKDWIQHLKNAYYPTEYWKQKWKYFLRFPVVKDDINLVNEIHKRIKFFTAHEFPSKKCSSC